MRRSLALVLSLMFLLQAPASAGPIARNSVTLSLSKGVAPLLSMIQSSYVFAVMTGRALLYSDMHMAPPVIPKLKRDSGTRPIVKRPQFAAMMSTVRQGIAVSIPADMPHAPFGPRVAKPDPLVISKPQNQLRAQAPQLLRAVMRRGNTLTAQIGSLGATSTGINHWWTYEEQALAGVGKAMVNVASGNLIVQSEDVDVAERGIDLALQRTYNSQSTHDVSNTDGSSPSVFGNGWTNTFDAHLAYDSASGTISLYDIDGARYDWTPNPDPSKCTTLTSSSCWVPPAGMQGYTLQYNGNCAYWYTKKSGTSYFFYSPVLSCNTWLTNNPGFAGRPVAIEGRNGHNSIAFSYTWQTGGPTSFENVQSITALHADGQQLVLTFDRFWTNTELRWITRPDGQQITYYYDPSGNLLSVTRPGNAVDDATRTQTITQLTEEYWYYAGTHEMQWVAGPRYMAGSTNNGNTSSDGSTYEFAYDANATSGRLTSISEYGLVNFTPNDGTGAPLQTGAITNANSLWRQMQFAYNQSPGNVTGMSDTDGHASQWQTDSFNRISKTSEWQGAEWLVTQTGWNGNNDVAWSTDARGNETDYTYDLNGNALSVQQPSVNTSLGTGRPIALYAYDEYSNLVSYCDPQYVWTHGTTGACPGGSGTTHYAYDYSDPQEPYGKLTDTYTPMGYHHQISYDQSQGDYGLPTMVKGDPISQNDRTQRTPTQTFVYDAWGNLTSYNKGDGAYSLRYDLLNRLLLRTDPDNVSSYTCYNVDGTVLYTESASQHALDGGVACQASAPIYADSQTYDADGNVVLQVSHHAQTGATGSSTTTKWYDGADRLVEVAQPQDSAYDVYAFPWLTRYIYDISQGQHLSLSTGAIYAYGNLYKTQECLVGTQVNLRVGSTQHVLGQCSFMDVRGNSFDALDRPLSKYELSTGPYPQSVNAYDGNGQFGLLSQSANGANQARNVSYDAAGRMSSETFADPITGEFDRNYTDDPDGRATTIASTGSPGAVTRVYDADGRVTQATTPSGVAGNGTISYGYYADGTRASLGLAVPAASYSNSNLFAYNYRDDGLRSSLIVNGAQSFTWTYSPAGREQSQTDPFTGTSSQAGSNAVTYVPLSYTYDSYGRVASETLPRGFTYNTFAYDVDDANIGWRSNETLSQGLFYTRRNELTNTTVAGNNGPVAAYSMFANGAQCSVSSDGGLPVCTMDSRSSTMLSSDNVTVAALSTLETKHTFVYDGAGRETSDAAQNCSVTQSTDPSHPVGQAPVISSPRTYDAENHIVAQIMPAGYEPTSACYAETATHPWTETRHYTWGPDAHLAQIADTTNNLTTYTSYGWDGDALLYQVAGNQVEIAVEQLGVLGGTVYDRDWTGSVASAHDQNGYSAVSTAPWRIQCNATGFGTQSRTCTYAQRVTQGGPSDPSYNPMGLSLSSQRSDGYSDGFNTFQGVRTYDPNMNQWTTPDAYSGDVHDPMSQKPYMWNDNNPVAYQDPSGYCVEDGCVGEAIAAGAVAEGALELGAAAAEGAGDKALAGALTRAAGGIARAESALQKAGADGLRKLVESPSGGQVRAATDAVSQKASSVMSFLDNSVKAIDEHIGKVAKFTEQGNPATSATRTLSNVRNILKAAVKILTQSGPKQ